MSRDRVTETELADLYRRYSPMVYRRCLRFFDPAEAEDVMQEIFVHLIDRMDSFRGDAKPSSWLYRVATNFCLKRVSRQARRRELWRDSQELLESPSAQLAGQESRLALSQLWHLLPEDLVTIGVYYHGDGMSQEEIGELMGLSRRTVGNRLATLAQQLERLERQQQR